jgi:hypothetical protein
MVSLRVPPTFMPATPWSQPWITWPRPSANANGSLRSRDESNFDPLISVIVEPAGVMDGDALAAGGGLALTDDEIFDAE